MAGLGGDGDKGSNFQKPQANEETPAMCTSYVYDCEPVGAQTPEDSIGSKKSMVQPSRSSNWSAKEKALFMDIYKQDLRSVRDKLCGMKRWHSDNLSKMGQKGESGSGMTLTGENLDLWKVMHDCWGGRDGVAMPHRLETDWDSYHEAEYTGTETGTKSKDGSFANEASDDGAESTPPDIPDHPIIPFKTPEPREPPSANIGTPNTAPPPPVTKSSDRLVHAHGPCIHEPQPEPQSEKANHNTPPQSFGSEACMGTSDTGQELPNQASGGTQQPCFEADEEANDSINEDGDGGGQKKDNAKGPTPNSKAHPRNMKQQNVKGIHLVQEMLQQSATQHEANGARQTALAEWLIAGQAAVADRLIASIEKSERENNAFTSNFLALFQKMVEGGGNNVQGGGGGGQGQ